MQHSLMKPKCFHFLILLGFSRLCLTDSSIDESNARSYVVERRSSASDLFVVSMKNGNQCRSCDTLGASFHQPLPGDSSSCGCTCLFDNSTFLPSLGICPSSKKLHAKLTGNLCPNGTYQNLFGADNDPVLKFPVNLTTEKTYQTLAHPDQQDCKLFGYFFDYSGFQVRWKRVSENGIFNLTKSGKYRIKMKDKKNKLSGRVIKLNLTCTNKTQEGHPTLEACYIFKALGRVTYSAPVMKSSVHTSLYPSSPSPQSTQPFSMSLLSHLASLTSPSPSFNTLTRSPTTHTGKYSHTGTRSLQTRPALQTSRSVLPSASKAELASLLPVDSEEVTSQLLKTGMPSSLFSTREANYSEPSELPTTELSLPTRDGPGDKEARASGKDKGVAVGAGVGGAVAFGIIVVGVIIILCRRKKSRENTETKAKLDLGVKNPVYGKPQDDIEIERPKEKAKTLSEQESQPTYMELVDKKGHENCGAVYSSLEENYDNSSVYQTLNKKTPTAPPVYQSLQNNQPSTKEPIPKQKLSNVKKPEKPSVQPDPVYSVLEESDTKQEDLSEALYNVLEGPDPGHDTLGYIQDPVYNVLDGPDAGQTYEAPDVGVHQDPLYNVLEVPESKQEHQEPLYNVLESADTEIAHSRQEAPHDGAVSEPLYNVLDGADSGGANVSGAEYASPNRPLSRRDNPDYEQTLEFGVPNAVVHSPGSQRESFYEPLEGSDRQDVYEPLQKRGNNCT
ncbi:uncharacterized protein LOC111340985 isoform X2 [Stylophora pistillata]|uniref:uncharacterized protein LOC111340985 isoform X2 n=1 Tax=Stylophora pistillata TaxID=50429 RepID=UPI000C054F91|nr:uncharacterized protein LOC111340985 isoform X2 [Stylophora pistillata]